MAARDYDSSPVADSLGLRDVILGLASDLDGLRKGTVSPAEGLARAAVAKQMFNGVRLYLQAVKTLEGAAKPAGPASDAKMIEAET